MRPEPLPVRTRRPADPAPSCIFPMRKLRVIVRVDSRQAATGQLQGKCRLPRSGVTSDKERRHKASSQPLTAPPLPAADRRLHARERGGTPRAAQVSSPPRRMPDRGVPASPELVDLRSPPAEMPLRRSKRIFDLGRRQPRLAADSAGGAASFAAGTVVVRVARPAPAVRSAGRAPVLGRGEGGPEDHRGYRRRWLRCPGRARRGWRWRGRGPSRPWVTSVLAEPPGPARTSRSRDTTVASPDRQAWPRPGGSSIPAAPAARADGSPAGAPRRCSQEMRVLATASRSCSPPCSGSRARAWPGGRAAAPRSSRTSRAAPAVPRRDLLPHPGLGRPGSRLPRLARPDHDGRRAAAAAGPAPLAARTAPPAPAARRNHPGRRASRQRQRHRLTSPSTRTAPVPSLLDARPRQAGATAPGQSSAGSASHHPHTVTSPRSFGANDGAMSPCCACE